MRTVTFGLSSMDEKRRRTAAAFRGQPQGERITFESLDLLWRVLTKENRALLQALTGRGFTSVRELALRVDRDAGSIAQSVRALALAGIVDEDEAGDVRFPYSAIRVGFTLTMAA